IKYGVILRWKLAIVGRKVGDTCTTCPDTCFIAGAFDRLEDISFTIPDWLASGPVRVRIRLCDCSDCDQLDGDRDCPSVVGREAGASDGTCVQTDIPCTLAAATTGLAPEPGPRSPRPPSPTATGGRRP